MQKETLFNFKIILEIVLYLRLVVNSDKYKILRSTEVRVE